MEPQQRQFLQTQGPVARREFRHPLRFCAPEGFCPLQGVTPVMGERGKATMSTKCSSGAVPGGVLVTLPPRAKSLAARRRRNSPAKRTIQRPDEGIGPYKKRSSPPHPAPSGPPSLSPLAFGHLPLTRGVGPRGDGFRRRAAKPPPRHRGRKPKHRNPCGRADREKKISARRPVWTVNHRRKE